MHRPSARARPDPRALLPAALIALLSAPLAGQDAERHVAPWGADSSVGTADRPFRTVQRAVQDARPGDSIVVHAGTYTGPIQITASGTRQRPITLRGAGDGAAVLRAALTARPCSATEPARDRTVAVIQGADYWRIEDLTVEGGLLISGADVGTLGDHVTDRDLPGRGLYDPAAARNTIASLGGDPADGIEIVANRLLGRGIHVIAARDGRIEGNEIGNVDCGIGAAIWLNRFSDGWTIRRNHIHDIAASSQHYMSEGIRLGGASMYNVLEDNTVERANGPGRGIATDVHASWNVIRRNRVVAAEQGFSEQSGGWGNQWLENAAEGNRRFGFNVYGQSSSALEGGTPTYLEMRCNRSVGDPTSLSIGSVARSVFADNDFQVVDVSSAARDQWGALGNTWDGAPRAPDSSPPSLGGARDCSPGPAPPRIWGDVSRDGVVDRADGALVLSHAAGLATPEGDAGLADVDGDGRVTSRDALLILRHAAGNGPGSSRIGLPAE